MLHMLIKWDKSKTAGIFCCFQIQMINCLNLKAVKQRWWKWCQEKASQVVLESSTHMRAHFGFWLSVTLMSLCKDFGGYDFHTLGCMLLFLELFQLQLLVTLEMLNCSTGVLKVRINRQLSINRDPLCWWWLQFEFMSFCVYCTFLCSKGTFPFFFFFCRQIQASSFWSCCVFLVKLHCWHRKIAKVRCFSRIPSDNSRDISSNRKDC